MENLHEFSELNLQEQLALLEEMERQKRPEDISALAELVDSETDTIVLQLILKSLEVLLEENEEETINGLSSDNDEIRMLCIAIAGARQFESAPPVLRDLARVEQNTKILLEVLSSLSKFESQESLEAFRIHMHHADSMIATQSIEMIGRYEDAESTEALMAIIANAEDDDLYERCEMATHKAIEAIGRMGNGTAISTLVSNIHHRNPTVRRLIHEQLGKIGTRAVFPLSTHFSGKDMACKIIASHVLGEIGGNESVAVLVKALSKGTADHVNIKTAIYEALGKIPCQKSLHCLAEGLSEEDEATLITVISALDKQVDSKVAKNIAERLNNENTQSQTLLRVIAFSKARNIFELMHEEEHLAEKLVRVIEDTGDQEVVTAFRKKLQEMESARAKADAKRLEGIHEDRRNRRLLIVDDDQSAHLICQSLLSPLGFDLETAENGQKAMEILKKKEPVDLMLVDMNMPVMDGIELTRKVRAHARLRETPIIMVTSESEESQRTLAETAGIDEFVTKPLSLEELQGKIEALLPKKKE